MNHSTAYYIIVYDIVCCDPYGVHSKTKLGVSQLFADVKLIFLTLVHLGVFSSIYFQKKKLIKNKYSYIKKHVVSFLLFKMSSIIDLHSDRNAH